MKRFAALLLAVAAVFLAPAARADSGWSIQFLFSRCTPGCGELNGVNMLNGKIGIIVGFGVVGVSLPQPYGVVLFTKDAGDHWNFGLVPSGSGILNKTEFIDQTTAIAVGVETREWNATILRSTDSGATWTSIVSGIRNQLSGVSFANEKIGIAVGDSGTILRTTDGGLSWTLQSSGTSTQLHDVASLDSNTAVAVGDRGAIVRTTDGGDTWTFEKSGTNNQLRAVSFADFNNGIVVGSGGLILSTTDGGETWVPQVSGTSANLLSIAYIDDANTATVGGVGTILRTSDGGTTWRQQELPIGVGASSWSGISVKDGNAIAVGFRFVLRTLTGGEPVTCTAGGISLKSLF